MNEKQLLSLLSVGLFLSTSALAAQEAACPEVYGQSVEFRVGGRSGKACKHYYNYITEDGLITCIEEVASGEDYRMRIRYTFDETERFVCATSSEMYPKKRTTGWSGSSEVYMAGQGCTSRGSGEEKPVDAMAWEALMVCRAHQLNPKGAAQPSLEAQLEQIRAFRTSGMPEAIVNVSCASGVSDVRILDIYGRSQVSMGCTVYNARGKAFPRYRAGYTDIYDDLDKEHLGRLQDDFVPLEKAMEGLTPEFISTNLPGKGWQLETIGYVTPASAETPWRWGVTFCQGDAQKHFLLQDGVWTPVESAPSYHFAAWNRCGR